MVLLNKLKFTFIDIYSNTQILTPTILKILPRRNARKRFRRPWFQLGAGVPSSIQHSAKFLQQLSYAKFFKIFCRFLHNLEGF